MNNFLKILICYHKKDVLLKDDVLTPIHVGRALAKERMQPDDPELKWMLSNMIGDDTGDNISRKNASYNELTAIYWAWKNYKELGDPAYIGFMHYRRHFIFRKNESVVQRVNGMGENYLDYINYNPHNMVHLFDDCDYIAHIGRVDEVYKHYKENHHIEDLDLALSILKEKHPSYAKTADDFLKMSKVNFCNMFIMPKKMFFEYCEWLFSITEEFEKKVDLSEKRLFISERLTAIFIEQKKREGNKQKSLSSTFVQAPMTVPVAIPCNKDSFLTAVTMLSVLKHADKNTKVKFYLLHTGEAQTTLSRVAEPYPGASVTFIDVTKGLAERGYDPTKLTFPDHYPLAVSELVPDKKVLYLDERSLFFGDIGNFYTTCNNDEFRVIGIPQDLANPLDRRVYGNVFSLNAGRLRTHGFLSKVINEAAGKTSAALFNAFETDQVGIFPWWIFNVANAEKDGEILYDRTRGDTRWGVWNRALLYFDRGVEPWYNLQALYSVYWWEVAALVPASVPFSGISPEAGDLWTEQSRMLCTGKRVSKVMKEQKKAIPSPSADALIPLTEEPKPKRKITLKAFFRYWKKHGFKQTVRKIFQVLRGK